MDTLEHNGPMFPSQYKPHNLPIIYNGEKIYLQPIAGKFNLCKINWE